MNEFRYYATNDETMQLCNYANMQLWHDFVITGLDMIQMSVNGLS